MELHLEGGTWILGEALNADVGGFGRVFRVTGEDGATAVAKLVHKLPGAERELLMGDSVRAAGFKNVVPVLDKGEYDNQLVLVMPLASKSLAQHLESNAPLEEAEVLAILIDVAEGLADIVDVIVHRDIKPQNVLFLDGTWCLADFGIAKYAEMSTGTETFKMNVSWPYASPEQWRFESATSATDVYSFGVLAYQLLSGRLPFVGPDFRTQHLADTPPPLTVGSARLRAIIEECMFKPADARPRASNLLVRLRRAAEAPVSTAFAKLAEVNQAQVRRIAETQANVARAEINEQYLTSMVQSGLASLEAIVTVIADAVDDHAPTARITSSNPSPADLFAAYINGAMIQIAKPLRSPGWEGSFTVIAESTIDVRLERPDRSGWRGRAHSLWFCDAEVSGDFGWYELAFMDSPFGDQPPTVPYPLDARSSYVAFQNVIGSQQLAWPLSRIDRDDPSEFVERWLDWFAEAASGVLQRPHTLPERSIAGVWRRG